MSEKKLPSDPLKLIALYKDLEEERQRINAKLEEGFQLGDERKAMASRNREIMVTMEAISQRIEALRNQG